LDNENKNEELLDLQPEVDGESLPESDNEAQATGSVEDETVARLASMEEEISADLLQGIPVTPLDSDEEDGESDDSELDGAVAEEMCILCGENPADKSYGENYDLCTECRKRMVKTPLSFSSILFFIIILGIGLFGWVLSATQLSTLQAVSTGYDYAQKNQLYSAVQSFSSAGSVGWKTARSAVDMYQKSGYLSGISSTVSTYFYDAEADSDTELTLADKIGKANLNAPWNKNVKKISTDYNKAMEAYEKYYAYFSEYDEQMYYGEIQVEDVPYDDLIKKLEEAKKTDKSTEGLAFINYCEWYLTSNCEKGLDLELKYMKEVQKARPDYTWLYLSQLTELFINAKDYETAEKYCKQMEETNADDYYAQYYRAMILRVQGKYDEAIKLMDAVIADYDNNGFYLAYYEAGINAFLKGDVKKATSYIQVCYDGEYLNYNTANFYALLCKVAGDNDGYKAVVEMLQGYEMDISPTVEAYMNKKITALQLFNENNGVFESNESEASEQK